MILLEFSWASFDCSSRLLIPAPTTLLKATGSRKHLFLGEPLRMQLVTGSVVPHLLMALGSVDFGGGISRPTIKKQQKHHAQPPTIAAQQSSLQYGLYDT